MTTTPTANNRTWVLQWIIGHAIAWTLAMVIVNHNGSGWLVVGGLVIGAAEWLVLSRRFPIAGWWALGFGLGWAAALKAGWYFGIFAPDILSLGAGGGVLVGGLQWLALRHRLDRAGLWFAAFAASSWFGTYLGVVAGWQYYHHFSNQNAAYVTGGACVGAAIGLLSSVPLIRLLQPRA